MQILNIQSNFKPGSTAPDNTTFDELNAALLKDVRVIRSVIMRGDHIIKTEFVDKSVAKSSRAPREKEVSAPDNDRSFFSAVNPWGSQLKAEQAADDNRFEFRLLTVRLAASVQRAETDEGFGYSLLCRKCKRETQHYSNGFSRRHLVDAPMFGMPTRLCVERQAFRCRVCQLIKLDHIARFEQPNHYFTRRCVDYVSRQAALRPFLSVGEELGVAHQTISAIAKEVWSTYNMYEFPTPRYLGVDEIQLNFPTKRQQDRLNATLEVTRNRASRKTNDENRRRKYKENKFDCAVLVDLESGLVLDILPVHDNITVAEWLSGLPEKERIRAVAMDFAPQYEKAVRRHLPNATIVVDAFHVVHQVHQAFHAVRKKDKARRSAGDLTEPPRVFDRKIPDETNPLVSEIQRSERLQFSATEQARVAFAEFRKLWRTRQSDLNALHEFDSWYRKLPTPIEAEFKSAARTIYSRCNDAFVYFMMPISNAQSEASNNVTRRIHNLACHCLDFETLRMKLRARRRLRVTKYFFCDECHTRTESYRKVRADSFKNGYGDQVRRSGGSWLCPACALPSESNVTVFGPADVIRPEYRVDAGFNLKRFFENAICAELQPDKSIVYDCAGQQDLFHAADTRFEE